MKAALERLREAIRTKPGRAIAISAAAGVCLAMSRSRDRVTRTAARAVITLALARGRELAIESVLARVRAWIGGERPDAIEAN